MIFSIRKKLTIIYIMLILMPMAIVNYISIDNMQQSVFKEVEVNTLKSANVIAGIGRDNFDDIAKLKATVRQYVPQVEGRLLVLDNNKRVIVDSFNLLEGEIIDNEEIRSALASQERKGYYYLDKRVLQAGVPIIKTLEGSRKVIGVVLIAVTVEELFNEVEEFRNRLILLSIAAMSVGLIVAVVASNHISKPIIALSHAAKRIGKGNLGETLDITTKDEIGKLVDNFNYMSKELYRIDKGRMQFIGDVSHELKTPLAAMKALIDSLLYGEEDIAVFKEYLGDMDTEIDRLSDIIKALLKLTKIEEVGINPQPILVKEQVDEVIKLLRPLSDQKEISIYNQLNSKTKIIGDRDRIKEVFINLIDNAIKYSDVGKTPKEIHIKGEKVKEAFVLTIQDNGIGISQEDVSSVFEKFYRTDLSRSRDTGGAGIGLSIVERIVRLHGWNVEVKSQPEKGTTFIITIPKNFFEISL